MDREIEGMKSAKSQVANRAWELVQDLQEKLCGRLNELSTLEEPKSTCQPVTWLRDEGRHGGGRRMVATNENVFNRASINVSQVHYDDVPEKKLGSANAISTIVHPKNPHAPSMHMHISWTEMKDGSGYWRLMADLNPSIPRERDKEKFLAAIREATGDLFEEGAKQGDQYFYIPALKRHRGVAHYYLEAFNSADSEADFALARRLGEHVIDCYAQIVGDILSTKPKVSDADKKEQLAYHTVYLLQVLSLDRGTTSGLLVHSQNDVGILGSLPSHVDPGLLASWQDKVPSPQGELIQAMVACLGSNSPALVDEGAKKKLAQTVRDFYQAHPAALEMQAKGNIVPPTVANHSSPAV